MQGVKKSNSETVVAYDRTKLFSNLFQGSEQTKIHVIGWNKIKIKNKKEKILKKVGDLSYFYFIHSFKANPKNKKNLICSYKQQNQEIPALVSNNLNTIGCQFHPEKSGKIGLQILKNFISN